MSYEQPQTPPVAEPEVSDMPAFVDAFPSPEDWVALQGGKPRVFCNPDPQKKWVVLHVYEEHDDPAGRFQSGAIVDTLPRNGDDLRHGIIWRSFHRLNEEGDDVERVVALPSFMMRDVHGDECESRSRALGGDPNGRVVNQGEYAAKLHELRSRGYKEVRFGVDKTGFKLTPLPDIRPPRPLAE